MKRTHLLLAVCALLAVAVTASVATAATHKKKSKGASKNKAGKRFKAPGDGGKALAEKLGVTTAELKTAIESARKSVGPPALASRENAEARETHCTQVTDAAAAKLGVSGDAFRTAAKDVAKDKIAKDLTAGRLTQAQADAMTAMVDASKCAPLGGPPRGCAGPGRPAIQGGGPGMHRGPGMHDGSDSHERSDGVGGPPPAPEGSES